MSRGRLNPFALLIAYSLLVSGQQSWAGEFVFDPVHDYLANVDPDTIPVSEVPAMELTRKLGKAASTGDKVRTVGGMACFRFDENDYRCAKINPTSGRSALVVALDVDGPEKATLDQYCFTVARAWKDRRCDFDPTFVVAKRGMDQMEMTFVYLTKRMTLTHWSKY